MNEFRQLYATELAACVKRRPRDYSPFINITETATRMMAAIPAGSFNMSDAHALRAVCRNLGIEFTRPAIMDWFAANVDADEAAPQVLSKADIIATVDSKTDLGPHVGSTVYARTAMNAYFGRLVSEKNGLVELAEAHDTFGQIRVKLQVPKINVWAVINHDPRTPTINDLAALRG